MSDYLTGAARRLGARVKVLDAKLLLLDALLLLDGDERAHELRSFTVGEREATLKIIASLENIQPPDPDLLPQDRPIPFVLRSTDPLGDYLKAQEPWNHPSA